MLRRCFRIGLSRRMRSLRQVLLLVLLMTMFMTFSTKLVIVSVQQETLIYSMEDFNMSSFVYPLEINIEQLVKEKITKNTEINIMPINPHPFKYIHNPSHCKFDASLQQMNLLILVKSAAKNYVFRHAIRSTWGQLPETALRNIRIVYMLGANPEIQKLIDFESRTFNDIVQENFIDAYRNNTYKTIMSFNWAVTFCKDADFLLFVDDDLFVNVPKTYQHLASIPVSERNDLMIGLLNTKEKPERDANSRWYVPVKTYPFPKYPPYLAGGAYATTISTAVKVHLAYPYVQSFWVDDVYLGIVTRKLNITPRDDPKFHFQNRNISIGDILVAHRESHKPSDMVRVWETNV